MDEAKEEVFREGSLLRWYLQDMKSPAMGSLRKSIPDRGNSHCKARRQGWAWHVKAAGWGKQGQEPGNSLTSKPEECRLYSKSDSRPFGDPLDASNLAPGLLSLSPCSPASQWAGWWGAGGRFLNLV